MAATLSWSPEAKVVQRIGIAAQIQFCERQRAAEREDALHLMRTGLRGRRRDGHEKATTRPNSSMLMCGLSLSHRKRFDFFFGKIRWRLWVWVVRVGWVCLGGGAGGVHPCNPAGCRVRVVAGRETINLRLCVRNTCSNARRHSPRAAAGNEKKRGRGSDFVPPFLYF